VVSVTPRPRFTPGKGPPVPIVQEAGWAGLDTEARGKILFLYRELSPGPPVCSATLHRLSSSDKTSVATLIVTYAVIVLGHPINDKHIRRPSSPEMTRRFCFLMIYFRRVTLKILYLSLLTPAPKSKMLSRNIRAVQQTRHYSTSSKIQN
jgi:hypothetical protein